MLGFKVLSDAVCKMTHTLTGEVKYAYHLLKKSKPQTLGEGLKRVKRSMNGVGENLTNNLGERVFKTSDGSFMNIKMANIVNPAKNNQGIGTVLRVNRPKLNPLKDGTYGLAKARLNARSYWDSKHDAYAYISTVKLKTNHCFDIVNQKTKSKSDFSNVFGKYCRDGAQNIPFEHRLNKFSDAVPSLKFPERNYFTPLWSFWK